jgi:AcrR family transcriptional regulator
MPSKKEPSAPPRKRVRRNNQQDADQLRERFVEAAFDLFAEGGLEAVSIRSVAAKVGVSPMVMYWYFADKSELLSGLTLSVLKNLSDQLRETVSAQPTARRRLQALVECFLSYWEKNPGRFVLVYGFTDIGKSREGKSRLATYPMYGELLDLGQGVTAEFAEELGVPTDHVKLATDVRHAMLLGYLHGTMVVSRYPWAPRETLRETYIALVVETVERCLREGPPAANEPSAEAGESSAEATGEGSSTRRRA